MHDLHLGQKKFESSISELSPVVSLCKFAKHWKPGICSVYHLWWCCQKFSEAIFHVKSLGKAQVNKLWCRSENLSAV